MRLDKNKNNRKTWSKGRVSGTAKSDNDDLPNDPPSEPGEYYNKHNPEPDKIFYWTKRELPQSRLKKDD